MDKALKILKDNAEGIKGSFIYFLHEQDMFNEEAFYNYLNSINEITNKTSNKPLDREVTFMIIKTYSYILRSFIYHLAPSDLLRIKNYPEDKYFDYIEELKNTVDNYIQGAKLEE